MKSPITCGEVRLEEEQSTTTYKGMKIKYTRKYYRCLDTGIIFSDNNIDGENLKEIKANYDKIKKKSKD